MEWDSWVGRIWIERIVGVWVTVAGTDAKGDHHVTLFPKVLTYSNPVQTQNLDPTTSK